MYTFALGVLVIFLCVCSTYVIRNKLMNVAQEASKLDLCVVSRSINLINALSIAKMVISLLIFVVSFIFIDKFTLVAYQKLPVWYISFCFIVIVFVAFNIYKNKLINKLTEQVRFVKKVSNVPEVVLPTPAFESAVKTHLNCSKISILAAVAAMSSITYNTLVF